MAKIEKPVLVCWYDAFGASPDWTPVDELDSVPLVVKSVGYLAHMDDTRVVIVPHLSDSIHPRAEHMGCGDMTIPAAAVISIHGLETCEIISLQPPTKAEI